MDNPAENPSECQIKEMVEIVRQKVLETEFPLMRRTDTPFLAKFIRSKGYDVEKAIIAFHKYYENLYSNLRLLEGLHPAKFADVYNLNAVRLLKHNFNGAKVIHASVNKWDTSVASLRDMEHSGSFVLEDVFQNDKQFQLHGAVGIIDLSGLGFSHLRQVTYSEIKFLIKTALQMFPLKVAGLHFLNAPTLFWPIYKFACKLLPQKIRERIYFHSSLEQLVYALSPDILPKFLGGNIEDDEAFDTEIIANILHQNIPYECYWNGAIERPYQPRRLTRKRSSMLMS